MLRSDHTAEQSLICEIFWIIWKHSNPFSLNCLDSCTGAISPTHGKKGNCSEALNVKNWGNTCAECINGMGFGNTDIIPQCSSLVLTNGSISSHRNTHTLIVLLVLNCYGQLFWDPQRLSVILGKQTDPLSQTNTGSGPFQQPVKTYTWMG